ncbi:hypothetical protein QTP88_003054 [Uroleucon formosanum]
MAEPTGMLNLCKAINKFESEHNYKFTFLASTIGKDFRDYTNNADLGLDPVHSVSNNVLDILHYPLRYGLIPTMSSFDLEMFLESIFLNNCYDSESTRQYKTGRFKKVRIELIEGEIEALFFDYWSRLTVDLIKYDERIPRSELKDLLKYLYLRLCVSSIVVSKSDVDLFLTNFRKFAKFDLNDDIIPVSCVFVLKTKLSVVWSEISPSSQTLWSAFFNEMNVQHFLTAHTISAMFETLDRHFEFIMSKTAQVRAFRGTPFPDVSLWCSNATSVPRECYYIVREEDVISLISTFFRSFTDIESLLCTAIDNFYYYHIFLLSRYATIHNIDVATRVLTSTAVQRFLDDRKMDKYYQKSHSHVISYASERMQSMMVSCFRRLYIRDSDKFEAKFKITEFDLTLNQSLNELIYDRMNSALYPILDREGNFSPERFCLLHPTPNIVVNGRSSSSNHLCCYEFASSLYAHMYGLTIREHVLMRCDELKCNFKGVDKRLL